MPNQGNTAPVDLSELNHTTPIPYNGTIATGGNSLTQNLNVFYEVCLSEPQFCRLMLKVIMLTLVTAVWRHCLDDDGNSTGTSHDSGCRVCTLELRIIETPANLNPASSTLVSPGESLRCR